MFSLYSPKGTYDSIFLANYANINLNDEFTRVKGIASVTIFGAGQYAMRIWVKPDTLAKLGVTIPEILQAMQITERGEPGRDVGGEPSAERAGICVCHACARAFASRGGVWRDRRARESRWLHVAGERRRPHRTRRAELRNHRAAQRQACRDRLRFTSSPARMRIAAADGAKKKMKELSETIPGGPRLRRLARYHARSDGGYGRDPTHAS